MLEKDRASATRPLRHSCHLSQDKNRTKQNHESGKCRLLHVFQVFFFSSMSSAFASIWGHNCRSASGTSFFCTTKSEIYWQELSTGWPGPWQKPPTNRFPIFLHCNNKQAVKRFLIAIRNSKTIPHWPISHSPVQFMGYLVVFINCAILLGGFWISASSVQIMHNILPKHWFPVLYFFLLQNWCSASQGSSSTNVTSSDKECTLYSQMKLSSSKSAFTKLTWKHPQNHPHCYHPRRRSMSSDFVKLTCRCHFVRARLPQMSAVTRPAIPSFPHHHHQD